MSQCVRQHPDKTTGFFACRLFATVIKKQRLRGKTLIAPGLD
jgi:hypothetical protein